MQVVLISYNFNLSQGSFKRGALPTNTAKSAALPLNVVVKEWTTWPSETNQANTENRQEVKSLKTKISELLTKKCFWLSSFFFG